MNQERSSKFVPGLPADDDDNTSANENIPTAPDSTINIFEGIAECTMKDSDNLKSVKIQAKNLAQDNVQKQIAEYIRAFLKDRYLNLPDDETLSIANEISNITAVKYNTRDSDDDIVIRATVTAQLDNKDIMNYIIKFFKERAELKSEIVALRKENEDLKRQRDKVSSEKSALDAQNKDLKSQNEALRKENEDLERQINELKRQRTNGQKNTPQVISEENIALSKRKYNKACKLFYKNDYEGAIKLCNEAIQLNPNGAVYYCSRGNIYSKLGQYKRAIRDYDKALELNPNYTNAKMNREDCFKAMGK